MARGIIKQQWQRWDGLGRGSTEEKEAKRGKDISPYTRLVKIADEYSIKHIKEEKLPVSAIFEMVNGMPERLKGLFDPNFFGEFLGVIQPYAMGHEVELNTGEAGVVVDFNKKGRPCRPKVKVLKKGKKEVEPRDVDLEKVDNRLIIRYESNPDDCSKYYYEKS